MLSFECIKNEKSVYFLLTSAISNPRTRFWAAGPTMPRLLPKTLSNYIVQA